MGWTLCEDGVEGHIGGQIGFDGTMVFKRTDQGTAGILAMTNIQLSLLEEHRRGRWLTNYYFKLEQLLLHSAEEMLARESGG
jgi:hypothetical protein